MRGTKCAGFFSYFNPFDEIIETRKYPNARTLRTGFWQKMSDIFRVFTGSYFGGSKDRVRLLDYATLMVQKLRSILILS